MNSRQLVKQQILPQFVIGLATALVFQIMTGTVAAQDFLGESRERTLGALESIFDSEHYPNLSDDGTRFQPAAPPCKYPPWSGGRIPVAKIEDYPRIPALDRTGGLFDTYRANLFGRDVPEEWDFQNLINTDRPDFTDATFSVGKGVTLIETGFTYRQSKSDDLSVSRRQLPEMLVRTGITDEFELRIKWNGYVMTEVSDKATGLTTSSFGGDDLQLGFKYEVLQQEGWRPMLTFVGGSVIPTGTRGVSSSQLQPFGNVVYGYGLRRWLYLKASTGVDFARASSVSRVISGSLQQGPVPVGGTDNVTAWHQSVSLLYQATQRVGGFVEWFSFFSANSEDNRAQHFVDTGLFIYVSPNVQVDMRVGTQLSNRSDTGFAGAGLSLRY